MRPNFLLFINRLILAGLFCLGVRPALAQGENNNWYCGDKLGIGFVPQPTWLRTSSIESQEPNSTISDAAGNLLFYTNGITIWNRNHGVMTNACATCDGYPAGLLGHTSAQRGALIVSRPGTPGHYYVFATDAREHGLANGVTYSEVDMSLSGGLGGVTAVRNVQLPTGAVMCEGVAGMQHANRRDVWVVVQGVNNGLAYSFLVTPAGVSHVPVTNPIPWNSGLGFLKFSPDGHRIARSSGDARLELYDFDASTGRITNPQVVQTTDPERPGEYSVSGLEFSPDNSKLYLACSIPQILKIQGKLVQLDLQAGSLAAIRSSAQTIRPRTGDIDNVLNAVEMGPDGRIYVGRSSSTYLGCVVRPNQRGAACVFQADALPIGFRLASEYGLQNFVRPQPPEVAFNAEPACLGAPMRFTVATIPTNPSTIPPTYTWHFGGLPGTIGTDSASGPTVFHAFAQTGTYLVQLTIVVGGQAYTSARYVTVDPRPRVTLSREATVLRQGSSLQLRTKEESLRNTYRWSDGSTGRFLTVAAPGKYWVEVSNEYGCTAADTILIKSGSLPNIITPNGDGRNETLVMQGWRAADWQVDIYNRWGRRVYHQESYQNLWNASDQPAGVYYYYFSNLTSAERLTGWVEVVR
ncbi:T9SS type B sorting domain-containing protein [Hymenobacter negativus]|uniref:Gliding motility-associated C-terminal domain-containing protein n=1 Tax=Hymenobacter negativus TaxID=2795026 RepID=A0ABS0QC55_9BACT|nr:gliding motility-associated C-terminal domain-containing protein [Hymenobacter negativus]MBH8559779.1 gliding motility-associated C-terminal domain-containing protein [Hymenobacter negativus]